MAAPTTDSASTASTVRREDINFVAVLHISNPPVNALHPRVVADLDREIDLLHSSREIRCVVITGDGPHFVAGGDIKFFSTLEQPDGEPYVLSVQRMQAKLGLLPQPVIAALEGFALGGGLELALACDIRVAGELTIVGLPEVGLGVIPAAGGALRLSRLASPGTARQLAFTGARISARKAMDLGIIEEITADREALPKALLLAQQISANSPAAVAAVKRMLTIGEQVSMGESQTLEATLFARLIATNDFTEGIDAFLHRRTPAFTGS